MVLHDGSQEFYLLVKEKRQSSQLNVDLSGAVPDLMSGIQYNLSTNFALTFRNQRSAIDFLTRFTRDPRNLLTLRQALAQEHSAGPGQKVPDAKVIEQLGSLLVSGQVQILAGVEIIARVAQAGRATPKPVTRVRPASSTGPARPAPKAEKPDAPAPQSAEPVIPLSELAQAQALKEAARDGNVLCEKCEEAAKSGSAAA